jgi:hypothetical protein
VGLVAERQPVLRLERPRLALGVVEGPLVERDIPFHGASTSCSPSSIAFARTTSSSAVSRATLPISLRYIRTGSSIPIMSALIASSSSASAPRPRPGRASRRVQRQLRVHRLAVGPDDLHADVPAAVGEDLGRGDLDRVVVVVLVVLDGGQDDLGGPQPARGELASSTSPWPDGAG